MNVTSLISAFGALLYAIFGLRIVWSSIPNVVADVREYFGADFGGGGFFAVDGGAILVPLLLVAGSIAANRMLASWGRTSTRAVTILHRTQFWAMVIAAVFVIAIPVGFWALPPPLPLTMLPLSGVVWGVQFLTTAALLAAYARTART